MAFGASLTPLDRLEMPEDRRERLAAHGITSVEELIDAIDADESSITALLDMTVAEVGALRSKAFGSLSEERREELKSMRPQRYATGALPPLRDG